MSNGATWNLNFIVRLTTLTDVLPLSEYTDVPTDFYHIHHHKAMAADADRQSNKFTTSDRMLRRLGQHLTTR